MSTLLDQALEKVGSLPSEEQDAIAAVEPAGGSETLEGQAYARQ